MKDRTRATKLAADAQARGDATGWFEALYASAQGNTGIIPWADLAPNEHLEQWLNTNQTDGKGKRALVVGCGLGDDAEELARRRFHVTAFDISPTAIDWCRQRFGASNVNYLVADALQPPSEWQGAFDFTLESYTLQALPTEPRAKALSAIAKLVAPGGSLLIICRAREESETDSDTPPWRLTHEELLRGTAGVLTEKSFEDFFEPGDPPVRRFRIVFTRTA